MTFRALSALFLLTLVACGSEGAEGDECNTDADCGDLHCHIESGEDHGHCEDEHDE